MCFSMRRISLTIRLGRSAVCVQNGRSQGVYVAFDCFGGVSVCWLLETSLKSPKNAVKTHPRKQPQQYTQTV